MTKFNYCCPLYNGGQLSPHVPPGLSPWPFGNYMDGGARPGCTQEGPYLTHAAKWIGNACKMCAP